MTNSFNNGTINSSYRALFLQTFRFFTQPSGVFDNLPVTFRTTHRKVLANIYRAKTHILPTFRSFLTYGTPVAFLFSWVSP